MDHFNAGRRIGKWLLPFLLFFITSTVISQTTIVTGTIVDEETKDPLPFVSVFFKNAKGVTSDSLGHFEIITARNFTQLNFASLGFKSKVVNILPGTTQTILVELSVDATKTLNNVVVKSKKKIKYSNKNNPAVELIRLVIDNRDKNRPEFYNYLQYEQYEKMQLSLSRIDNKMVQSKLLKNFGFIFENRDTTKVPGKTLIPVYMEESLSSNYFRRSPEKLKTFIEAGKKVNFSSLIDSNGISQYLDRLYEKVDIYDNNVALFTHTFLSPIADMAPTFYMFFVRDTITEASGTKLVRMYFTPRNTNDLLFRGTMYISLDTNHAVQKLNMTISPNINLNFVREIFINQEFERNNVNGKYHLSKSSILTDIGITKGKSNGMYGERTVTYKNYVIDKPQPDKLYEGLATVQRNNAIANPDSFWLASRHEPLTEAEVKVYKNIDSLRNLRQFKRFVDIANFLMSGYLSRKYFDIGPGHAFYGYNPVEGFRLRFGGRSTTGLSKRVYFETYGAYGFRDKRWKGFLSVAYSINNQSVYRFPYEYIKVSAQYDTKIPGAEGEFVQEDNIFLSVKRGKNDKYLYNTIYRFDYVKEFLSRFSFAAGFKYWQQEPAGNIRYDKPVNGGFVNFPKLTTSEISLLLRWAPNEKFYQGMVYRTPIINQHPTYTLRYTKGVKGLFGGEYNYHSLNLSIEKRAYLSQLGYNDILLEGGYIFGQVPFPLLTTHRANQTYAYQLNSYNLMNFLEFVSDRYVAVNMDHHLNGFLFNRVPLLKKLDWREVFSFKAIFGAVREENNPETDGNVYKFPANDGKPTTFALNKTPYIEASMGIENILKIVRIEVVKRFTYLDNPDITKIGIRGRLKVNF
ncbi:MAG: DUF5686 family protein [Bacteroidota bacterium]